MFIARKVNLTKQRTFWPHIYTTNVGIHRLLHDIPRFLFLFLVQLFFRVPLGSKLATPWVPLSSIDYKWGTNSKTMRTTARGPQPLYYVFSNFSDSLHKSCQPCPIGPNWPCPGVICSHRLVFKKNWKNSLKPWGKQLR